MVYADKTANYFITIALACLIMVSSIFSSEAEAPPQAAFLASFMETLERELDFEVLLPYAEDIQYAFDNYAYYIEKAKQLLDEHRDEIPTEGFTPAQMRQLLNILPGFNEVSELLTEEVIMDVLSLPGLGYIAMHAMDYAFPQLANVDIFALLELAEAFGAMGLVQNLFGDDLPTIELFSAIDHFAGEGFTASLLEMEINARFVHLGHVFAAILANEVNYLISN
ncbi:MAG: hypothetical protein FWC67_05160 [Defluviitaleaceae bacterium]|nr:hypothetical protein [Defluviitaleaceae bacterium]